MSYAHVTRAAARGRRGFALIYGMASLVVFSGMVALAVDWGRVQVVRTELAAAADAAARAGAAQMNGTGNGQAQQTAATAGEYNRADGQAVVFNMGQDLIVGTWDQTTKTFTTGGGGANAVRAVARRTAARGNAVQTTFGMLFGRPTKDVEAAATAALMTDPVPSSVTNKSNPWLAGMPSGTHANGYDSAPSASPTLLVGAGLTAGAELTFEATGATSNQEGVELAFAPDGNLGWIIHNYPGNENGIADLKAPISALIGVFLSDTAPNAGSAPATLDFTTAASRDFATLSPELKQPFFIGDAKRADGTLQKFVVPTGATRLFVGSMDGQQWSDNAGGFSVTVKSGVTIYRVVTVQ